MFDLVFVLAATALGVWAHRRTTCDDRGLRLVLAVFAIGLLVQMFLVRGAAVVSHPALGAALVLAAAATGLMVWGAGMRLVAIGTRGRDLWLRLPLLAAAALALILHAIPAALFLGAAATLSYRWRAGVATHHLFQLSIAALVLGVLGIEVTSRIPRLAELHGLQRAAAGFAVVTVKIATLHAVFASLVLFGAFARDPTLGIRRISRRLALSHALVALVPIALLVVMWIFTTVLGVNQDRTKIGARAIARETLSLRDDLSAAASGEPARDRLRALAEIRGGTWPGLRLWRREGGTLEQVAGAPMEIAQALAEWHDSLQTLGDATLVELGDSSFVGAAVRMPGDPARGAVALMPTGPVLERTSRALGVELHLARRVREPGPVDSGRAASQADPGSATAGDSLALERVRRMTRRVGLPDQVVRRTTRTPARSTRLVAGADTFFTERSDSVWSLTRGYTTQPGIAYGPRGWQRRQFMLASGATTSSILLGLADLSTTNPTSFLPVTMIALLGLMFLAIGVWDLIMVTAMGRSITRAIAALRGGAERMRAGDLEHRIQVEGEDDLWNVAGAFNLAAEGLERARRLQKEQDRIENELAVAQRIQSRLLPVETPRLPGFEIAGHYDPAREIGGDYYDHLVIDERRVLLVIADVSGKSVPAALIMSAFRAALVSQDLTRAEPAALASRLNEFLHHSLDPGKFVTAFLGFLDTRSGHLLYVNAGHNPPFLMRRDSHHETLDAGGTILGILPSSSYVHGETTLAPGDLVALYTDGVSEGANAAGEQWGDERLLSALRTGMATSALDLTARIAQEVRNFEGDAGPTDDITLLIARRTG